ncbi:hypothetical protein M9458_052383, partial [Cirrhinus mrigala]
LCKENRLDEFNVSEHVGTQDVCQDVLWLEKTVSGRLVEGQKRCENGPEKKELALLLTRWWPSARWLQDRRVAGPELFWQEAFLSAAQAAVAASG